MTTSQEASEIWQADRRETLVANLLNHRPAEFARPGALDPRLAAWACEIAGGNPRNLILTGPVGTGKTWALWHAAEHAVRAGFDGRVIIGTAARLRRVVAPATADPAEFARWQDCGLLAVDDLAAVRLSEWDLDHLLELVDARWAAQRPVAVTSNVTTLRTLLGERVSSRLAHGALIAEMDGPDRRRQP